MRLTSDDARTRFATARVARLATVRPGGAPHVVPVTFALLDDVIVIGIDHKPKTTTALQRLTNIEAEPRVSLVVDHYDEDWTRLWWVRADAEARLVEQITDVAIVALAAKYPQYAEVLPHGPGILATVVGWVGWAWNGGPNHLDTDGGTTS